jgi:hypothetical protein
VLEGSPHAVIEQSGRQYVSPATCEHSPEAPQSLSVTHGVHEAEAPPAPVTFDVDVAVGDPAPAPAPASPDAARPGWLPELPHPSVETQSTAGESATSATLVKRLGRLFSRFNVYSRADEAFAHSLT